MMNLLAGMHWADIRTGLDIVTTGWSIQFISMLLVVYCVMDQQQLFLYNMFFSESQTVVRRVDVTANTLPSASRSLAFAAVMFCPMLVGKVLLHLTRHQLDIV